MKTPLALLFAYLSLGFIPQSHAQSVAPGFDAWLKQNSGTQPAQPPTITTEPPATPAVAQPAQTEVIVSDTAPNAQPATVVTPAEAAPVTTTEYAPPIAAPLTMQQERRPKPRIRSGAFIGAQIGQSLTAPSSDISESVYGINAGYRWHMWDNSLLGIEVAVGKLQTTADLASFSGSDISLKLPDATVYRIGATSRANFGDSAWFISSRAGYWSAQMDSSALYSSNAIDGLYVGLGVGADMGYNSSLSLNYDLHYYWTTYQYSGYYYSYAWNELNYDGILSLDFEFRF